MCLYFITKTTSHILLFNDVSLSPQLLDQTNYRVEYIFGINDFILSEPYAHDPYSQINDSNTFNQTSGYKTKWITSFYWMKECKPIILHILES